MTLTHCTVSDNQASGGTWNEGGGIDNYATVTLISSIVANSPSGGDCFAPSPITSGGYNLDSDGSCGLAGLGDQSGVNPLLGPLQDNGGPTNTHALLFSSPAIDQIANGTNGCGTTITTDQREIARPQPAGGNCDIGAYEVEPGTIIVEKQTDPDGAAGSFTFSGGESFTLSDGEQSVIANVAPGSYTGGEDDPTPAFALTDITCDDGGSAIPSTWDVGTRTATVNLEEKETVTCTFTNTRQYLLTVDKAGGGGGAAVRAQAEGWSGTVTSEPAGINCGVDCMEYYLKDTRVTLTAHPGVKSYFAGWSGACDANGQVTVDADKTCTAAFGYPVGGIVVPVNKVALVWPWLGLVGLASLAALIVALVRRRKP